MYNPQQPTNYRAFRLAEFRRVAAEKRAREVMEAEAASAAETVASAFSLASSSSSFFNGAFDSIDTFSVGSGAILQGFDAETLVKERLQRSAELGVEAAKERLREEEEVAHKERIQQGKDMKSKIGKLLGKLGGGDSGVVGGAPGPQAMKLEFKPSGLVTGVHVLTAVADTSMEKKASIRGKPSSTVCLTLESAPGTSSNLSIDDAGSLLGQWVCQCLAQEGSKCGVVRNYRRHTSATGDVTAARFFLRFDSVASAFKMAERWDNKRFGTVCQTFSLEIPNELKVVAEAACLRAQFYPSGLYDGGNLDGAIA